jgi:hypothetical protein
MSQRAKPDTADHAAPRQPAGEAGQVLPFRRPGALFTRKAPRPPPVSDLGEYERRPNEPDDYRHRMIMNGLAFVATVVLVVVGIWIADVMAQMRKNQDCVLTGRPGCTHVDVPLRQR